MSGFDIDLGTTGAVLWKITPLIAEWLTTSPEWLKDAEILTPQSIVVELGCGIIGLLGIILAEQVGHYVLTDQEYVMKFLRENVEEVSKPSHRIRGTVGKKQHAVPPNLTLKSLDWELDSPGLVVNHIPGAEHVDLVIVCDCVYNEHLVKPLVQTLNDIAQIGPGTSRTTIMIAQQLRSDIVFESFLEALLQLFNVWRVPDSSLPEYLQSKSGFVVHLARLKQETR